MDHATGAASGDYKSGGFSEPSLPVVESMKRVGTHGDRGGDVNDVEAAGTKSGAPPCG